jgi:2-methylfumaryl-CoA isomerase
LSDVAIGTVANLGGIAEVLHNKANRPRLGNAVYGLFGRDFVTKDVVRTMIVVVTHRQWANLIHALCLNAQVAAIETERSVSFAKDDGLRFQHREALYPLFEKAIGSLDHASMSTTLDEAGIVHSAYRNMLDAAHDPRLVGDNPMFSAFEANPSGFHYPAGGAFGSIPQMQRGDAKAAPRNGEHSEEILSTLLGLSSGEIARLIDSGILGIAK